MGGVQARRGTRTRSVVGENFGVTTITGARIGIGIGIPTNSIHLALLPPVLPNAPRNFTHLPPKAVVLGLLLGDLLAVARRNLAADVVETRLEVGRLGQLVLQRRSGGLEPLEGQVAVALGGILLPAEVGDGRL